MDRLTIIFLLLLSLAAGCNEKGSQPSANVEGYDMLRPHVVHLPSELDEISGLAWYSRTKSVFAISDEKGILFKLTPDVKLDIQKWKFSKKADYEDLVMLDSSFYIMQSNGSIQVLKFMGNDSIAVDDVEFPGKGNEFESMYYDAPSGLLKLICKDCEGDKKHTMTVYSFDPKQQAFTEQTTQIDLSELFKKLDDKFHFKASAAAVNPVNHELFIISSVNKMMLVIDSSNAVKASYTLDKGLFKQPEGMAFTDDGKMIISNESAGIGAANLLIFKPTKSNIQ